jgi:hypothetical protein
MKFARTLSLAAAVVLVAGTAMAATAWLQVVHNAADPGAAVVDIYLNNGPEPFINDFAFRDASPFVEVPANVNLNIGVAPGTSTGPGDIIADFDVVLKRSNRYVVMANGVLDPNSFTPNPDGKSIGFTLFAQNRIKTGSFWKTVRLIGFHGVTDAPAVDVRVRDQYGHSWTLIGDLAYGEFSRYKLRLAAPYELDVTLPGNPSAVVASYAADLTGLAEGAGVVFASGFLDDSQGPGFALCVALPDGSVLCLPPVDPMARLQVIHNAPDPAAAVVDIYVNEGATPFLNDFAFRAASPYVDVPAGVPLSIGVAPGTSTGPGDIIASFDVVLEPGQRYVAMASGVLDPAGFDPNPEGIDIAFTLVTRDNMREYVHFGGVKVIGYHGSPDAPAVDILARTKCSPYRKLADDLSYGQFSRYVTLWPCTFEIAVTLADDNSAVVAEYIADLRGASSKGVTVFASGFLNPAQGPAFGLFAALPDGTVLELPASTASTRNATTALGSSRSERSFALFQNSPNPFSTSTSISFALPEASDVNIKVYNAMGQLVDTVLDEQRAAGTHSVTFSPRNIANGVYFYRIDAGPHSEVKKMMVVK